VLNFVSQGGNDFPVHLNHSGFNKLVGFSAAAKSGIGQVLVQAYSFGA
jgi:hypothetical protein